MSETTNEEAIHGTDELPETKVYSLDYRYNGALWSIHLQAVNWADARRRLQAIQDNGEIVGEHVQDIPLR